MEAGTSANQESSSNTSMIEDAVLIKESLDFSSPWHLSDVVLVAGDTKLHVHKCILSMWSPVFEAMFTSQFKESTAKEIPLPGKRAEEMEVLLKFIYSSGTKPTVTEENYQFLLQLANEYQMERVKSMCSEFLVNKIQVSDCLDFFKLAEQFGLDDVTEKCYEEVRYNSSVDLEGSEHFIGFEPEFKIDICMRIIKELERTLEEYVTTCSDLVRKVYSRVYRGGYSQYSNLQKHIKEHRLQQSNLQQELAKVATSEGQYTINSNSYNRLTFHFSCNYCLKRVQEKEWNDNDSYSILKEPMNKLHDLQQNNKVAREAKKRAHRRRTSVGWVGYSPST